MKTLKSIKSQAALEFLTTYGWAFLIILIMIGTLAYFGILNPSKILPNRCTLSTEFTCLDYQIAGGTTNTFRIRIKNGVGEAIDVQSITLGSESTTAYTCLTPPPMPTGWKSGEIRELSWSNCNSANAGIVSGEKGKVLLTLRYYGVVSGVNYVKESKGEVYSTVI